MMADIRKLYESGLTDAMMQLLEAHFIDNKPLDETLRNGLDTYITSAKKLDNDEYDRLKHELTLISKSSKFSWDLFNIYRQILDHNLKLASESTDPDKIEAALCEYIKIFRKKEANEHLNKELTTYFESIENNKALKDNLENSVNNRTLSLVIGAGVTACYVGSWDKLLNKLMVMRCYTNLLEIRKNAGNSDPVTVSKMEKYMRKHIKTFISDNVNYLERGEYLRYDSGDISKAIGSKAENRYREIFFAEQVKQTIVDSLSFKDSSGGEVSLEDQFYSDSIIGKNSKFDTLSAVINLCVRQSISEIITYNFDTIVDRLIADSTIRSTYDTSAEPVRVEVYSYFDSKPVLILPEKAESTWKTVRIYHVHGIVDKDFEDVHPLIFSENSYQNYQKTALNWSNIRIADVQSRNNVLCIGFSGDDPNFRALRRFLEDTHNNPVMGGDEKNAVYLMRNYADEKHKLLDPDTAPEENDFALACIKTYFDAVISYFKKQYNVDILWSNGFDAMAFQINQLANL